MPAAEGEVVLPDDAVRPVRNPARDERVGEAPGPRVVVDGDDCVEHHGVPERMELEPVAGEVAVDDPVGVGDVLVHLARGRVLREVVRVCREHPEQRERARAVVARGLRRNGVHDGLQRPAARGRKRAPEPRRAADDRAVDGRIAGGHASVLHRAREPLENRGLGCGRGMSDSAEGEEEGGERDEGAQRSHFRKIPLCVRSGPIRKKCGDNPVMRRAAGVVVLLVGLFAAGLAAAGGRAGPVGFIVTTVAATVQLTTTASTHHDRGTCHHDGADDDRSSGADGHGRDADGAEDRR